MMALSVIKQGLSILGDVDDTPVDGATKKGISSNWAYDHKALLDAHTKNMLEQSLVGKYYNSLGGRAASNVTLVADRLCGYLIVVARTMTFDQILIGVQTAGDAGTAARLGIYNLDSALAPSTLVKDYGTVSVATTGAKTIAYEQQLTKGYYLGAVISDGAPILYGYYPDYTPFQATAPDYAINFFRGYYVAQAYGALPDPFPASPTLGEVTPSVWLRIKSLD